MGRASIPVDLLNPGQVFACLGFLEVADALSGPAQGGFDWTNGNDARFEIQADGGDNPFHRALESVVEARLWCLVPRGYRQATTPAKDEKEGRVSPPDRKKGAPSANAPVLEVETFPGPKVDKFALPLRLECNDGRISITHWCDASSRKSFKLFAGQQKSAGIAQQMRVAIQELWTRHREELIRDPLGMTTPLGGSSFKMDARKAWTTIDAGYSPDQQAHTVEASPVVELFAAIGLEHARPLECETREMRYGVWRGPLRPVLARAALGGVYTGVPIRTFRFTLDRAGHNKVVTFAEEETVL